MTQWSEADLEGVLLDAFAAVLLPPLTVSNCNCESMLQSLPWLYYCSQLCHVDLGFCWLLYEGVSMPRPDSTRSTASSCCPTGSTFLAEYWMQALWATGGCCVPQSATATQRMTSTCTCSPMCTPSNLNAIP
ncbi:hypothetical protein SUZIE_138490 [Sciurus carolinensis]|uniref:Uncharacterized protein n=1 Tax=Sciurus carolinensis TaxID=30640 RepID=A0AA41MR03_SCICA|nr:hypothetical protein [Sciurus carolinensis]